MSNSKPNVVLFITHDTGRHLSPYGIREVHTPNSQKLANEGVLFTNAFCTSPLCSPSRASIVTGRFPHQNGVMGLTGPQTGLFDFFEGETHAAQIFSDAGYESTLCGFEHESPDCTSLGFHTFLSGPAKGTNGGGDLRNHSNEIASWLTKRATDRPFYLQIGCSETHKEWTQNETEPDDQNGLWTAPYLSDHPDIAREMAEFQGAVRRLDEELGAICGALKQANQWDNTIFIFTTDHGIDFPRAKGTCYDPGIETFLFMTYPNSSWGNGRKIDTMTSNVDILPTLLEACGISLPDNLAGQSLLPILQGESSPAPTHIFAEKTYHDTYDPQRAIRTARYKYIRYFEVNIFEDLRAATVTRRHFWKTEWRRRDIREEALYDLENDPLEMNDVANDPAYADVKAELKRELLQWMQKTDDPLLQGPVSSPYYKAAMQDFTSES